MRMGHDPVRLQDHFGWRDGVYCAVRLGNRPRSFWECYVCHIVALQQLTCVSTGRRILHVNAFAQPVCTNVPGQCLRFHECDSVSRC